MPEGGGETSGGPRQRFFFLHVMKTGGATLRSRIGQNFAPEAVYPDGRVDGDMRVANYSIPKLLALPPERRERIELYTGHFPFVAIELLGEPLTTITILRDPVERTLSYLRQCKRNHPRHRDLELEEIYEDPFFFPCFIHNHQAKLFALTAEDRPESYMHVLEVDAERLALAKANLARVDVVGIQERHDELLAELGRRFGWRVGGGENRRVNPGGPVPESFRRRIAADNAADVEFYEHAVEICAHRRTGAAA